MWSNILKKRKWHKYVPFFSQIRIKISASYYTKQPPELSLKPQKKDIKLMQSYSYSIMQGLGYIFFAGVKYKMLRVFKQ